MFFWQKRLVIMNIMIISLMILFLPPASAHALDLSAVVAMALEHNEGFAADARRLDASKWERTAAEGQLLPRIDLSVTASHSDASLDAFGSRLQQGRIGVVDFLPSALNDPVGVSNYGTRLRLAWPLYAGGRLRAGRAKAGFETEAAIQAHAWYEQRLIYETIARYTAVLDAEAELAAEQTAVEAAEGNLADAKALARRGMVIDSDVLAAEVHVLKGQVRRDRARDRLAQARDELRRHLGLNAEASLELTALTGIVDKGSGSYDLPTLTAMALRRRADLLALQADVEAGKKAVRQARAAFLPHIDLVAQHEWNERTPTLDNGHSMVALTMGVNLLAGGSDQARVARAEAEAERRRLELAERRRVVVNEVRQTWRELAQARRRFEAEQQALATSREALRIVSLRHRQGLEKTVDLLAAQRRLDETRAAAIQAGYDRDLAQARLLLVSGRLNRGSIQ